MSYAFSPSHSPSVWSVYLDTAITGTEPNWQQAVRTVQSKAGTTGIQDWAAIGLFTYNSQYKLMVSDSQVWPLDVFIFIKISGVIRYYQLSFLK
jgi:hypothetical protein